MSKRLWWLNQILGMAMLLGIGFTPVFAENWGWVDTRLLLILHPEMKDFDYANGRFFRPQAARKSPAEVRKELDRIRTDTTPIMEDLVGKRNYLTQVRIETILGKERLIRKLLSPGTDSSVETRARIEDAKKHVVTSRVVPAQTSLVAEPIIIPAPLEKRKKMSEEVEEKTQKQIASLDAQLTQIQDGIVALQETMYSPIYLTTPETNERLKALKEEILATIRDIANEQHIPMVMDTSYAMRPVKKAADVSAIPAQPDAPDMLSSALFHDFANWEAPKDPPPAANGRALPPQHGSGAMYSNKVQEFKKYLDYRQYVDPAVADFTMGKIFLIGGEDLTPLVAAKMLSKYNVPAALRNTYLEIIREFSEFEQKKYFPQELKIPK